MKISLKRLLKDNRLRELILVAGSLGLEGEVSRVSVLDAPDGPKWLKGGELILTSTFLFDNDASRLCTFCEQLINYGASGFGLKMGRYLTQVPQSLIDLCDRYSFPLLIIPYSYVWTDIISVFYELHYDLEREEKYNTLKSKLVKQIRDSILLGLDWIGDKIYTFFDVPMLFLDESWDIVASNGSQKEVLELSSSIPIFKKRGAHEQKTKFLEGKYFSCNYCLLDQFKVKYIIFNSESQNIIGELREILIDARVIEDSKKIMYGSEEEVIEQILPSLLLGEKIDINLLDALETHLESVQGFYCLMSVESCYTKNIQSQINDSIRKRQIVANSFVVYDMAIQKALIFLVFFRVQNHNQASSFLRQIMFDLSFYLLDEDLSEKWFISNVYSSFRMIEQCHQEATLTALYCGNMWPDRKLCHFGEVFPYYLIINSARSTVYLDAITELENQSDHVSFDCIETLDAFLRYGNYKQAAKDLFIHENTLRYRIKKIEEMICVSFDDRTVRQSFVIRMNLWNLKKELGKYHL